MAGKQNRLVQKINRRPIPPAHPSRTGVLTPALKAFAAANNGQQPTGPADLLPYLTTLAQQTALETLEQMTATAAKKQRFGGWLDLLEISNFKFQISDLRSCLRIVAAEVRRRIRSFNQAERSASSPRR